MGQPATEPSCIVGGSENGTVSLEKCPNSFLQNKTYRSLMTKKNTKSVF